MVYIDGVKMHTGKQNPQSVINEYTSGKLDLDTNNNKNVFPALNNSNKFATIVYDAQINTRTDYTFLKPKCDGLDSFEEDFVIDHEANFYQQA